LRLVAHLREEEENRGRHEDASVALRSRFRFVELVRDEDPGGHGDERCARDTRHGRLTHDMREPGSEGPGRRVVEERRDENTGDDGPGLPETRREHERQELRLVPELRERDDRGRDAQRFEAQSSASSTASTLSAPRMAMVASVSDCGRMWSA